MLPETYLSAFAQFVETEVSLARQYKGEDVALRVGAYLQRMHHFLSNNHCDFVYFDESGVDFFKFEFAERVTFIRDKLVAKAANIGIPTEAIFIPRVKLPDKVRWQSAIHEALIPIVRDLYDHDDDEQFQTLRLYQAVERNGELARWIRSKNGRNFLFEYQVSEGIRPESLIRKRLYLFDDKFVYTQMMYMSKHQWVHKIVVEAYNRWKEDTKLWKTIDHLKRKLIAREILDESRKEIKFLRLLEQQGWKGRFIHDTAISWQLKYRPDFWFVEADLIVEYDERAHVSKTDVDKQREKIIRKHIPNITFIRIQEGDEEAGIQQVKSHLEKLSAKASVANGRAEIATY